MIRHVWNKTFPLKANLFLERIQSTSLRYFTISGEKYYQLAKDHLKSHQQIQEEREESNRKEQYKKPGIAVVKTIVKQTRGVVKKNSKKKDAQPEVNYMEKAQECMQIAAFVHGHNDALVSLANEALTKQDFDAKKDFKYVQGRDESENVMKTNTLLSELNDESGARAAMKLYQYAGMQGSKEALFNLGHLHWMGHESDGENEEGTVEKNQELGLKCFENAAKLDDNDARYFLSVHYLSEKCIDKRLRGLSLLENAGKNSHSGALHYLALLHRNGDQELNIEPCLTLFCKYLDQAADGGDGDALFIRAHCMLYGEDGFEMDKRAAVQNFERAGEAGNADGFISAGAIYFHGGVEVKKDQRRAFELYQQAGEMGSIEGKMPIVICN